MYYHHRVLSILAWWAIPIGAVVVTAAVSGIIRRARRLSDDETIARYRRFREAIANEETAESAAGQPG